MPLPSLMSLLSPLRLPSRLRGTADGVGNRFGLSVRLAASAAPIALAAALLMLAASSAQAAPVSVGTTSEGTISWYGKKFAGRKTASGERFDPTAMTMAHPSWPFGTRVRVTNLGNDKSVVLRVNDRGPTIPDRIADVSEAAARALEFTRQGITRSRLEVVGPAPPR